MATMATSSSSRKRKFANGSVDRAAKRIKSIDVTLPANTGLVTSLKHTSLATKSVSSHSMFSRARTLASTRAAVFNTQELLENILFHLPIADILTVRGVNKHWNALIVTSPKLQHQLCIATKPCKFFWACELKTARMERFLHQDWPSLSRTWRRGHNVLTPSTVNGYFFEDRKSAAEKGSLMHRAVYCESFRFRAQPDLRLAMEKGSDGVVEKMFVCQPPTETIIISFTYGIKPKPTPAHPRPRIKYDYYVRIRYHNKNGVAYGELVRGFLELVDPRTQHIRNSWSGLSSGICNSYYGHIGDGDTAKKADLLAINVKETKVWVKRMIFPTREEFEMVEWSAQGHRPSEAEVKELGRHVGAVGA